MAHCGYDFKSQQMKESYLTEKQKQQAAEELEVKAERSFIFRFLLEGFWPSL